MTILCQRNHLYLFEFTEVFVLAQLLQISHCLRIIETIVVVDFTISRQLAELQQPTTHLLAHTRTHTHTHTQTHTNTHTHTHTKTHTQTQTHTQTNTHPLTNALLSQEFKDE